MKKLLLTLITICLSSSFAFAQEKSPVRVEIHSYQKVVVKEKNGKVKRDKQGHPLTKWVKASKVVPQTIVKYINTVINDTNEPIEDVKVKNLINPNLMFIMDSAHSEANFSVKYSVDGGKHFDIPENLVIVENKRERLAKPSEYNAVLFTVDKVPAHGKVEIDYKTELK